MPVIDRADLYPLFPMFNGQVELLTDWKRGDPNVLLLNSLKFHEDDGQRVKEALFSNHNANMLLETDGPSLVGRSTPNRGVAKKINVLAPLTLTNEQLSFDTAIIPAPTPPPVAATAAEYIANSAPTKMLTSGAVWGAAVYASIADSATITLNLSLGLDFVVTTGAGRTMANPINGKVGQKGLIFFVGGSVTVWGSNWKFPGSIKPVSSGGVDIVSYVVGGDNATLFCVANQGFG